MKWFQRWFKRKAAAVQEISEERLQEIFLAAPDAPLWLAVKTEIAGLASTVAGRAIDPKLSNEEIRFHLGGSASLLELLDVLEEREQEARKMQSEQAEAARQRKKEEGRM